MRRDGYFCIDRATLARLPEIGCTAMGVYLALKSHADDSGECWPSHETLSRAVGVSDRTVRTALRVLESAGLIAWRYRRRDTPVYTIQAWKLASTQEPSLEENDAKPGKKRPPSLEAGFLQNDNHRTTTKNEGVRRKESQPQFDPLAVELPFSTDQFRTAWTDFCEHRRRKKAPLTDLAVSRIVKKLSGWGETKAIESLDNSIEGNWTGVFEPKTNGKPAGKPAEKQPGTCKVLTVEEYANWNPYTGGNV